MKLVFFGTPEYVVEILEELNKTFKGDQAGVIAVVTQAPKPIGRKKILGYSAVDRWAFRKKIKVIYDLKEVPGADLGIVAAFGAIIPQSVINQFKFGILNIHPSLLPKHRGASPVQATIIAGEKETGVTIIQMDSKMDHGPIVCQIKEEIKKDETTDSLRKRLFQKSTAPLIELIPPYLKNKIKPREQNHDQASFTRLITKEDGFIPSQYLNQAIKGKSSKENWSISFIKDFSIKPTAKNIERFVRAMNSWPTAWTKIKIEKKEKRLKILKAKEKEGKLILKEVQLEGKNPVGWEQFQQGHPKLEFAGS